ncbi:hypothetical protein SAMN04490220_1133 [Rhodococcus jostii]|uniref:Uncharacterized protein n=1 Tax=Rhodococcus jostii TaxID=132919 RepID=A0A1H4QWH2_RHOJO|nr:hypothetical protein SAMN04490220_1133 [Rhodococcus jostii]
MGGADHLRCSNPATTRQHPVSTAPTVRGSGADVGGSECESPETGGSAVAPVC